MPAFSPLEVLAREVSEAGLSCTWHSPSHLEVGFAPSAGAARVRVRVQCTTDSTTFLCVSASSEMRVPPAQRRRVAELLAAVNAGYSRGGVFVLDVASGEVRCRASHGLCVRPGPDAAASRTLVDAAWKSSLLDAAMHYYVVERALALLLVPPRLEAFARLDAASTAAAAAFILREMEN